MELTRDFEQTLVERAARDKQFAHGLLDEAATLFRNGERETARMIRDVVNQSGRRDFP